MTPQEKPSEFCEDIFTIKDLLAEIYRRRKDRTRPCEDTTTTTTNFQTSKEGCSREDNFTKVSINRVFQILTGPQVYGLYRGKSSKETAKLVHYLALNRGAITIRNPNILGPKGIFTDRRELHNVMLKLEDLGLVEKYLQKPWSGGRPFAIWKAVWASNSDVQLAIEEHNNSLDKQNYPEIPPTGIPNEKQLIKASMGPKKQWTSEDQVRRAKHILEDPNSSNSLKEAAQTTLQRLVKEVEVSE